MEDSTDTKPLVPRNSSTVLLLRDSDDGPEVYMLRRSEQSDVLGGVHVFPGGKLDREDCESESLCRIGSSLERLHEALGEPALDPAVSAGLFFAACRETFEEAQVLLARSQQSADSSARSGNPSPPSSERAWALLREGFGFNQVLASQGLELATDQILPWSRWITPRVPAMMRKRFDTRFFVAALPSGQVPGFDDHEAVDGEWMNPRDALRRYRDGGIVLGPPQIMSLLQLTRSRSVAELLEASRTHRPPVIEPEPFDLDGRRAVAYPGDERHPVRERALFGPTRLIQRNARFEPPEGIDALLEMAGC